jgi:hypothetical protein
MATKNLAKTAIEGGRTRSNKLDRRYSHQETRAAQREFLSNVKQDIENYYDYDIKKTRHVHKQFNDKLQPMYRWLASQCGRPWNEVRSEVSKKFDDRTTAGHHILHDHLLSSVEEVPNLDYYSLVYSYRPVDWTTSYRRYDFYVDDGGILREKTVVKYDKTRASIPSYDTKQIANWLSGRVVGKVGSKLFWFIPADKNKKRGGVDRTWRADWVTSKYHYANALRFLLLVEQAVYKTDPLTGFKLKDEFGNPIVIGYEKMWTVAHPSSFRQGSRLSNKEAAYFNKLPEYYQQRVLELSPSHPNPIKPFRGYY